MAHRPNHPTERDHAEPERWLLRTANGILGPFDAEAIAQRIRSGDIETHHRLSIDGVRWLRASAIFGRLFDERGPGRDGGPGPRPSQAQGSERRTPARDRRPVETLGVVDRGGQGHRTDGRFFVFVLTTVTCLALAMLLAFLWTSAASVTRNRETAVLELIEPSVVMVRGTRKNGAAWRSHGLVVATNQVVFPKPDTSLHDVTVEVLEQGRRSRLSAIGEVLVDSDDGLALVEVGLHESVPVVAPARGPKTGVDDEVLLIPPPGAFTSVVETWTVRERRAAGEPAERMLVSRLRGSTPAGDVLGCPFVDRKGRLIGLAVAKVAEDAVLCVPAAGVRTIQQAWASSRDTRGKEPVGAGADAPAAPGMPLPAQPRVGDEIAQDDAASPAVDPPRPAPATDPSRQPARPSAGNEADRNESAPRAKTAIDEIFIGLGDIAKRTEEQILPLPELTESDARRLGDAQREHLLREHSVARDRALVQRVSRLVNELLAAAKQRPERFTVTVLQNDENNAFAFVGRNIGVNTGFIDFANGDTDMERFVLAHEIGHIVLGHTDIPFRRALLSETILPGSLPATDIIQRVMSQTAYNQADEAAADCFAVQCLETLGVSPQGGVRFFEKLRSRHGNEGGDATAGHSLFSSHPSHATRIKRILNGCQ